MIFPQVRADIFAQIGEQVRISGAQTLLPDFTGAVIEIQPHTDLGFQTIVATRTDEIFLDWVFTSAGPKNYTLRITKDMATYTALGSVLVLTALDDNLFSTDSDILSSEPDLLRYLPEGRSNYNYVHREAQKRIVAFLDEQRIWKDDHTRYTVADIKDLEEFKHWSRFMALMIIFESLIVTNGDVFEEKMRRYADLMASARKRATLRLDQNTQGEPQKLVDRVVSVQVRR